MKQRRWKFRTGSARPVKKFLCALIAIALAVCTGICGRGNGKVLAAEEAQNQLDSVNNTLDSLEDSSGTISDEISDLQKELDTLLVEIESLQQQLADKQTTIDQCTGSMDDAEAKADEEYARMKLRIRYMYENSTTDNLWTALFESDGIADFLNRVEYITDMYQSDRELLTAYQDAVDESENLANQLTSDMSDLQDMEDSYIQKRADLESKMASLEAQQSEYQDEMERYITLAEQYEETIESLGGTVQEAEEASERRAALEEARSGIKKSSEVYGNFDPDPVTDVSGEDIVAYARQFVGNPYVWGGDSLTDGCDCSGFIHLVYAHFGISTPRYSQAFLNEGQVVSYNYMQPGDVIIYPGHCAIYMGNGLIVEAQGKDFGITDDRSVNCHTITGIRRYI